jgi:hypothetical protein
MDTRVIDILRRSEWPEADFVKDRDVISFMIDGEIIECVVSIHPKEICVKLLKEGIYLMASAKLMLMAPVIYTTEVGSRLANDYCIMRLKYLAAGLYHDYQIITNSRNQIKALFPSFISAKNDCNTVIADLYTKKKELKKDYKDGKLSQKEYIKKNSEIKDNIFAQQQTLTIKFSKIFNPVLSDCSHCDNLMGTIETLTL